MQTKETESTALATSNLQLLLNEIELLRKEKEEELQLRFEAEKQIELSLQKTGEIQKRMSDWKTIQDAAMKDCESAIIDMGNELYSKLSRSHKIELDEIKCLLEQINKKLNP